MAAASDGGGCLGNGPLERSFSRWPGHLVSGLGSATEELGESGPVSTPHLENAGVELTAENVLLPL